MSEETVQAAVKVTEQELNSVRTLSESFNRITMEIGELNVAKIDLENELNKKRDELNTLRQEEIKIGDELEAKYDKGRLNLQDGTYAPF
tara:strand:- start:1008 stop:1274 length:267 start_codon:yes stop_codon:yes gene_type:complete